LLIKCKIQDPIILATFSPNNLQFENNWKPFLHYNCAPPVFHLFFGTKLFATYFMSIVHLVVSIGRFFIPLIDNIDFCSLQGLFQLYIYHVFNPYGKMLKLKFENMMALKSQACPWFGKFWRLNIFSNFNCKKLRNYLIIK
jgi:hypothetical protein